MNPTMLEVDSLPYIDLDGFHNRLFDITLKSRKELDMLKQASKAAKFNYLFNASSYDCNKIITAELFALMMPELKTMLQDLDLDSHERINMLYDIGTVMAIKKPFGNHGLKLNKPAVILKHAEPDERNKIFMLGLQADGTMGRGLYQYGIDIFDAYYPDVSSVDKFINEIKSFIDNNKQISLSVYKVYQKIMEQES